MLLSSFIIDGDGHEDGAGSWAPGWSSTVGPALRPELLLVWLGGGRYVLQQSGSHFFVTVILV